MNFELDTKGDVVCESVLVPDEAVDLLRTKPQTFPEVFLVQARRQVASQNTPDVSPQELPEVISKYNLEVPEEDYHGDEGVLATEPAYDAVNRESGSAIDSLQPKPQVFAEAAPSQAVIEAAPSQAVMEVAPIQAAMEVAPSQAVMEVAPQRTSEVSREASRVVESANGNKQVRFIKFVLPLFSHMYIF